MWRQVSAVLGALALSSPSFASEPATGFYTGFDIGVQYTSVMFSKASLDFSDTSWQIFTPAPIPVPLDNSVFHFSPGPLADLYLGYRFNSYVRTDMQIAYAVNSISDFENPVFGTLGTMPGYGYSGRHLHVAAFVNGYYDFPAVYLNTGRDPTWVPYLGAGVGYGRYRNWYTLADDEGLQSTVKFRKNLTGVQGIAGFSYYWDSYTNLILDYRYLTSINKTVDFGKRYSENSFHFGILFNISTL